MAQIIALCANLFCVGYCANAENAVTLHSEKIDLLTYVEKFGCLQPH